MNIIGWVPAYTTGRRICLIAFGQRNSHTNGLGSGWSISDDASTNTITWTQQDISAIFFAAATGIQAVIWTTARS